MHFRRLVELVRDRRGQDLIEWVLLAGFFSAVAIAGIPNLMPFFKVLFDRVYAVLVSAHSW
jgi:hypothetical protein